MTRGRKPKPKDLKILSGTFRPDRQTGDEPQATAGVPVPPQCISDNPVALAEWHRIVDDLAAMKTLATLDTALVSAYCAMFARWQHAESKLLEMGDVVRGASGGALVNPYFGISQRCARELRALAQELGLSAASRTRLRVSLPEEPDELEAFLNEGNPTCKGHGA